MHQAEFQGITCNLFKAREKSRVQGTIAYYQLKKWREIFKPITERNNSNRIFTLNSHLKTALLKRESSLSFDILESKGGGEFAFTDHSRM